MVSLITSQELKYIIGGLITQNKFCYRMCHLGIFYSGWWFETLLQSHLALEVVYMTEQTIFCLL